MNNPTVTVLVLVEAGSKYETLKQNGLSHFLEHMCFKGTIKRPNSNDIARELDTLGTHYNAFTGQEYTGYYAKGRANQVGKLIDIVSDLYLNPTLPEAEIEKEKGVIRDEINMYEDMPARKVHDLFQELLYGDTPAGRSIAGTKERVSGFKRADFIKYREANYVPNATTIIVAGDIDTKEVETEITKLFKVAVKKTKQTKPKVVEKQKAPALTLSYKKTDQTHILLGFRAFDTYHTDSPVVTLLAGVLGAGMSSRLFAKVRDEMGCGYYVGAYNDTATDTGVLTLRAGVAPERSAEVVEALLAECTKLKTELVSDTELEKVKEIMAGSIFMGLESTDAVAEYYGGQAIVHKDIKTPAEIEALFRKITPEDIQKVAQKICVPQVLNLALIGPHKNKKEFEKVIHTFI
jgi:predicted Zn-dependent peptidase